MVAEEPCWLPRLAKDKEKNKKGERRWTCRKMQLSIMLVDSWWSTVGLSWEIVAASCPGWWRRCGMIMEEKWCCMLWSKMVE